MKIPIYSCGLCLKLNEIQSFYQLSEALLNKAQIMTFFILPSIIFISILRYHFTVFIVIVIAAQKEESQALIKELFSP